MYVWQCNPSVPFVYGPMAKLFGPYHRRAAAAAPGSIFIHTYKHSYSGVSIDNCYRSPWRRSWIAAVCSYHVCMAAQTPRRRFSSSWRRRRRTRSTPTSRRVPPPQRCALLHDEQCSSLANRVSDVWYGYVCAAGIVAGCVSPTAESLRCDFYFNFHHSLRAAAPCDIYPVFIVACWG